MRHRPELSQAAGVEGTAVETVRKAVGGTGLELTRGFQAEKSVDPVKATFKRLVEEW